jgi:hypothetical protein
VTTDLHGNSLRHSARDHIPHCRASKIVEQQPLKFSSLAERLMQQRSGECKTGWWKCQTTVTAVAAMSDGVKPRSASVCANARTSLDISAVQYRI